MAKRPTWTVGKVLVAPSSGVGRCLWYPLDLVCTQNAHQARNGKWVTPCNFLSAALGCFGASVNRGLGSRASHSCRATSNACIFNAVKWSSLILVRIFCLRILLLLSISRLNCLQSILLLQLQLGLPILLRAVQVQVVGTQGFFCPECLHLELHHQCLLLEPHHHWHLIQGEFQVRRRLQVLYTLIKQSTKRA